MNFAFHQVACYNFQNLYNHRLSFKERRLESDRLVSLKEKYMSAFIKSRRNILFWKDLQFPVEFADDKFASYLNLRKRQRFCAIQLGAYKDLIKFHGNGSATSMLSRCITRNQFICLTKRISYSWRDTYILQETRYVYLTRDAIHGYICITF